MSAIDDALMESAATGRWSFAIQAQTQVQLNANSMLYAQIPSWATRPWTINLCQMRYSNGPLLQGAAQPADNQVSTSVPFQARITWGVDGALEAALVDYPWSGCTFCVQGSVVQVDILGGVSSGATQPLLKGFLAPVPAVQTAIVSPTLTQTVASLAALANVVIPIPTRGTAYRIFTPNAPPVSTFAVQQQDATGHVYQQDGSYPPTVTPPMDSMQNRSGYYPINAQATEVLVVNSSATTAFGFGLQFLLDLG